MADGPDCCRVLLPPDHNWLAQTELVGKPDENAQAKIDEGLEVGRFACELFQDDVLVEARNGKLGEAIAETTRLMPGGETHQQLASWLVRLRQSRASPCDIDHRG